MEIVRPEEEIKNQDQTEFWSINNIYNKLDPKLHIQNLFTLEVQYLHQISDFYKI